MDDVEQAKAYADADFSEAHDSFVTHFRQRFPEFIGGHVLDLGCGTADVILRFGAAYPGARIKGIDGAQAMLDIGRRDVDRRGYSAQVTLVRCLLPDHRLATGSFDAVISNSLLHHLADPGVLWETLWHCAKKGAPLFIMDLMRPSNKQRARELVQQYAGDASPLLQKDFYNSLLAAYVVDEVRAQLDRAGLGYLTAEAVSDRHLIVWGSRE